ncbi:MAG: hypothetical protein A2365_02375 [Candidatus Nealsonbacteria bacterium RIFOXYB1_FULL_40_15]|uniref:HD domain-containing protein n=2 Tax=Candidatus Nealsoniibacteriota TaxID=1817911 RepID=A0A1G2EPB2_9BACT|nr:MAG: hypothetical protein A2365_02375 [Candidatus Nealsonbacteria bacterium RIFOXYB1_FULL_40_15]OGZ27635.1 MAG: hypothetical protein A2427_02700 [Candidatus Nealsonbacteria bacterium RIFOXYC1_FULL_40_7]OGZ28681.1 MAG: hypothetical protein A2562_00510 [Candidatus Nealsonbacteria bacterium RIFOXYD1_FULL_39_11]
MNNSIPEKYQKIWKKCEPILRAGRGGDYEHALETVQMILDYKGQLKLDLDILIPTAMMHDIGHIAILDEHLKYVTGAKKLINSKLVHMLTGAKIAKDILESAGYDKDKSVEIIDIISMHDADSLKGININEFYNTDNKKIFHDFDRLDRFSEERIRLASPRYENKEDLFKEVENSLNLFFLDEFKQVAHARLETLRKLLTK